MHISFECVGIRNPIALIISATDIRKTSFIANDLKELYIRYNKIKKTSPNKLKQFVMNKVSIISYASLELTIIIITY